MGILIDQKNAHPCRESKMTSIVGSNPGATQRFYNSLNLRLVIVIFKVSGTTVKVSRESQTENATHLSTFHALVFGFAVGPVEEPPDGAAAGATILLIQGTLVRLMDRLDLISGFKNN